MAPIELTVAEIVAMVACSFLAGFVFALGLVSLNALRRDAEKYRKWKGKDR